MTFTKKTNGTEQRQITLSGRKLSPLQQSVRPLSRQLAEVLRVANQCFNDRWLSPLCLPTDNLSTRFPLITLRSNGRSQQRQTTLTTLAAFVRPLRWSVGLHCTQYSKWTFPRLTILLVPNTLKSRMAFSWKSGQLRKDESRRMS